MARVCVKWATPDYSEPVSWSNLDVVSFSTAHRLVVGGSNVELAGSPKSFRAKR